MYGSAYCLEKGQNYHSEKTKGFFQKTHSPKLSEATKILLSFTLILLCTLSFAGPKNPKLAGGSGNSTGRSN